jgi:hypothetical protein
MRKNRMLQYDNVAGDANENEMSDMKKLNISINLSISIGELHLSMNSNIMRESLFSKTHPNSIGKIISQGRIEKLSFVNSDTDDTNILPTIAEEFPTIKELAFTDIPKKWIIDELKSFDTIDCTKKITLKYTDRDLYNEVKDDKYIKGHYIEGYHIEGESIDSEEYIEEESIEGHFAESQKDIKALHQDLCRKGVFLIIELDRSLDNKSIQTFIPDQVNFLMFNKTARQ